MCIYIYTYVYFEIYVSFSNIFEVDSRAAVEAWDHSIGIVLPGCRGDLVSRPIMEILGEFTMLVEHPRMDQECS